jgi:TolB-like protein/tetratricopeptide (TPR) repeat protein
MSVLRFGISAALWGVAATALRAQCPDGTPPPCAVARVASAPHRVDPPLDDGTWIVVPFNNVTRAPDVDWLRDASVNLLSLDLSRWQDIRVVDDARVADLARQVPEARTMPLSLAAATAMARRAGAGRLVMGSFIKLGARTTLAAKVFDVRRGSLVRSAQQDLIVQDSLMPVFGRLAQGVLNVAPPPGTNVASIGTSRVDAYQEYLAGTQALNRFDFAPARAHLEQALKLDSTFALAHYEMAILIGWDGSPGDTKRRSHAAAAARLSGPLPTRERALMKGLNAFEQDDYGVACETYGTLVQADSNDVEALYGVGECSYHDDDIVPLGTDTTQFVFRASWNTAIRVFERALRVDPSFHLAFQHILDIFTGSTRYGRDFRVCPPPGLPLACEYRAYVRRDHDTLVTVPVPYAASAAYAAQRTDYLNSDARRFKLLKARDKAQAWVSDAPGENRALVDLGHIFILLGDAGGASREFAQLRGRLNDIDARTVLDDRLEIAFKLFQRDVAHRLFDSLTDAGGRAFNATLFGRTEPYDSTYRAAVRRFDQSKPAADRMSPIVTAYHLAIIRAIIVGGTPMLADAERALLDSLSKTPQLNPTALIGKVPSLLYALEMPRSWPALDYPSNDDHQTAAVVALSRGDTVRLRAEVRAFDSVVMAHPSLAAVVDSGAGLFTAQAFLALHDSAAALRIVRRMLDSTLAGSPLSQRLFGEGKTTVLSIWPRLELMRADLEAAVGDKTAARLWYKRFLDLWGDADLEFAPMVNRARAAYSTLPPPAR